MLAYRGQDGLRQLVQDIQEMQQVVDEMNESDIDGVGYAELAEFKLLLMLMRLSDLDRELQNPSSQQVGAVNQGDNHAEAGQVMTINNVQAVFQLMTQRQSQIVQEGVDSTDESELG